MKDVMVDLETLGNTPGSAFLSIGAVAFDPDTGEIDDPGFYSVVNVHSCVIAGLRFDQDTLDWWAKQSEAARQVLKEAWSPNAPRLADALHGFSRYVHEHGGASARVWGNGADFDNALLTAAFKAAGIAPGWKFWNSRCFRTLKNLYPKITVERIGTFHNALDDAKTQAVHALRIFAEMRALERREEVEYERADAEAAAYAQGMVHGAGLVPQDDLIG